MPNSWDNRDVHPVKMRKSKLKPMKTPENKMLGKEHVLKEIKKHIEACHLVDKNQPRPKLFPSCVAGNTHHSCNKHIGGLLKFSMLTQDWSSCITLDSELSTKHFPSMDSATIALHFDYKHNDRGSFLLKEDGTPVLACVVKMRHVVDNGKIQETKSNACYQ